MVSRTRIGDEYCSDRGRGCALAEADFRGEYVGNHFVNTGLLGHALPGVVAGVVVVMVMVMVMAPAPISISTMAVPFVQSQFHLL